MSWRGLRGVDGRCEICGCWKWWRVPTKHGIESVCPNAGKKDHGAAQTPVSSTPPDLSGRDQR
jgi:hypothetical protein